MKRLLITGARGFIGRHSLAAALEAGFEVHALASSAGGLLERQGSGATWHVGDLLENDVPQSLIESIRPTHILHAAWVTAHNSYWTSPENLNWLKAGARLAEAFGKHGGRRFVAVGTCAEYDWTHGEMIEGRTPERPTTLYGEIKLRHSAMLQAAARDLGFSACTGRIFFAYGPHENPQRFIPYVCRRLNLGQEALVSSGQFRRDFMHVEDVAHGFIALIDSDVSGVCNVSSGQSSLLADIVSELGRVSGRADLIRFDPLLDRLGDPPSLVGANKLLRSTGWAPSVALEEGLRQTYEWWRHQPESDTRKG